MSCNLCGLSQLRTNIVEPRGSNKPLLYLIGLSPNIEEDTQGKAFIGKTGEIVWNLLTSLGLDESNIRVNNVCKCIARDINSQSLIRDPSEEEIAKCSAFLFRDILKSDPKIIVTLGNIPKGVLGSTNTGITKDRGRLFKFKIKDKEYDVLATYHPSFVLRNSAKKSFEIQFKNDLRKAKELALGIKKAQEDVHIIYDINELESTIENIIQSPEEWCSYDTETTGLQQFAPNFKIVGNSFCNGDVGYYYPFYNMEHHISNEEFLRAKTSTLKLVKSKKIYSHNCKFDITVNRVVFGEPYICEFDTMIAHHGMYTDLGYPNDLKSMSQRLLNVDNWTTDMKEFESLLGDIYKSKLMNEDVFNELISRHPNISHYTKYFTYGLCERFRSEYVQNPYEKAVPYYWYPRELVGYYAGCDAINTYKIGKLLQLELEKPDNEAILPSIKLMLDAQHTFSDIETLGSRIDLSRHDKVAKNLDERLTDALSRIRNYDSVKKFEKDQVINKVVLIAQKYMHSIADLLSNPKTKNTIVNGKRTPVVINGLPRQDVVAAINTILGNLFSSWDTENYSDNLDKFDKDLNTKLGVYLKSIDSEQICKATLAKFSKTLSTVTKVQFAPSSYVQLGEVLYSDKYFNLQVPAEYQEQPTAAPTLNYIEDNYKDPILGFIKLVKIFKKNFKASSDMDSMDRATLDEKNLRIARCDYLVHGTVSGRFSTAGGYGKISIHTIPDLSPVRELVISRYYENGGVILGGDHSQLELRILASVAALVADDYKMIEDFKLGLDFHQTAAATAYKVAFDKVTKAMRRAAKAINFGIIYGKGKGSLARELGSSAEDVEELFNLYFGAYPGVREFIDFTHRNAKLSGYTLSPTGRRRYLIDLKSTNKALYSRALRAAQNTPIQGAASDITTRIITVLNNYYKGIGAITSIPLFIHDYLGQDVYPGELPLVFLRTKLSSEYLPAREWPWIKCPLRLDMNLGATWLASVPIKNYKIIDNGVQLSLAGRELYLKELLQVLDKAYKLEFNNFDRYIATEDEEMYELQQLYYANPPLEYEAFKCDLSIVGKTDKFKKEFNETVEYLEKCK